MTYLLQIIFAISALVNTGINVFTVTTIITVSVTIDTPVVGTPMYFSDAVSADPAAYAAKVVSWVDTTTGYIYYSESDDGYFLAGHSYRMGIEVTANTGYEIQITGAKINGSPAVIDTSTLKYVYIETTYNSLVANNITDINVVVKEPEVGATPSYNNSITGNATVKKDSATGKEAIYWMINDPGRYEEIKSSEKYAKGSGYVLVAYITPKKGFAFDENTKLTLNGDSDISYSLFGDGRIRIVKNFKYLGQKCIDKLSLNIKLPKPGGTNSGEKYMPSEDSGFKLYATAWEYDDSPTTVTVFENNENYRLFIVFQKNDDYYIDKDIKVYVNNVETTT